MAKTVFQSKLAILKANFNFGDLGLDKSGLAAKLLKSGSTYEDVNSQMGMSPVTINKIHFKTMGSRVLNDYLK